MDYKFWIALISSLSLGAAFIKLIKFLAYIFLTEKRMELLEKYYWVHFDDKAEAIKGKPPNKKNC